MPGTPVHDTSCILLASAQIGIAVLLQEPLFIFSAIGSFNGLLYSPDWDWDGQLVSNKGYTSIVSGRNLSQTEHSIRRVFGKVSKRWPEPLRSWLKVYALIFSHRKGKRIGLSHTPFIGTLIRLFWLPFPFLVLLFSPSIFFCWLIGLVLADLLHLFLDFFI